MATVEVLAPEVIQQPAESTAEPEPTSTTQAPLAPTLTATPAEVAAVDLPRPAADAPASPIEAPLEALPSPSLEGANLVYAATLRQIGADRYVIAGCVSNIGPRPETGVDLTFELRVGSARLVELRAAGTKSAVNARQAVVALPAIAPGQMHRVDIEVRSKSPLTMLGIRVLVQQARWLAGNVKLNCAAAGSTDRGSGLIADRARFTIDGQPVESARAIQVLQSTPRAHTMQAVQGVPETGSLRKTPGVVVTTPALFSAVAASSLVLAVVGLAAVFARRNL